MKKKLAIIGASYLQLPLIQKAREMGIETHVFAWEQGAVGREAADHFYPISIVDREEILKRARNIEPAGVASIASDLAVITVNFVADGLDLIGNSMAVTERTTDKYLMRKRLSERGLPCPGFVPANQDGTADAGALRYPLIVKPTDRSGSRGVTKIEEAAQLRPAVERAFRESMGKAVIVEEFVEGREISVEMISWQGEHHFLAVTDKATSGPPYFVETEQHQPAAIGDEQTEEIASLVKRALDALGVEYGASHSELILAPDGRKVFVEIGARMGGDCIGSHLVELSTGYDFLKGVIDVALGRFPGVEKTRKHFAGIYYLTAPPGRVAAISDNSGEYHQIVHREVFVKPGDEIREIRESGNRLGYYLYHGENEKFAAEGDVVRVVTKSERG